MNASHKKTYFVYLFLTVVFLFVGIFIVLRLVEQSINKQKSDAIPTPSINENADIDNVNIPKPEGTTCTMDVRLCPDGRAVGRVQPNCDFSPCPDGTDSDIIPKPSIYENGVFNQGETEVEVIDTSVLE